MIYLQDPRPVYEQIAEYYEKLILNGVMPEGEQMPSVRQVAQQESVNPNTVQKAFAALERDGYIYTVRGRGSFVADVRHLQVLREKKRDELKEELGKKIREARQAQVPLEEIVSLAEEIYGEGGKHV
ncbi:MAG: GntR family transcriptional regulator [Lachnospiraceae bacterium]|jgi:GntR family transcriptional regulator|nr:GntR family transcriptional regulator [Lachnospiraceae bacterium]MCH4031657.1 GntR family transcriptional regulator [Lachnospiraceae bacterium]MCH4071140.1 GntR family transcriptional regulator [Lachnospiraceae bacterium]MCH4108211.1 GntR family transcriptional regulator [Lachnospiraceae bacterium]MCI1362302.1 GntR family transcriptional regulator [Lachnospiraceae bacterium]